MRLDTLELGICLKYIIPPSGMSSNRHTVTRSPEEIHPSSTEQKRICMNICLVNSLCTKDSWWNWSYQHHYQTGYNGHIQSDANNLNPGLWIGTTQNIPQEISTCIRTITTTARIPGTETTIS